MTDKQTDRQIMEKLSLHVSLLMQTTIKERQNETYVVQNHLNQSKFFLFFCVFHFIISLFFRNKCFCNTIILSFISLYTGVKTVLVYFYAVCTIFSILICFRSNAPLVRGALFSPIAALTDANRVFQS